MEVPLVGGLRALIVAPARSSPVTTLLKSSTGRFCASSVPRPPVTRVGTYSKPGSGVGVSSSGYSLRARVTFTSKRSAGSVPTFSI